MEPPERGELNMSTLQETSATQEAQALSDFKRVCYLCGESP